MKTLTIALVLSLALHAAAAFASVTPANGCLDNKCAVEALFHPNNQGETIFVDRASNAQVALASNDIIVSGPDYGPTNPRNTYSA